MGDEELEALLTSPTIIRNRLKVFSARKNARCYLQIQKEFGSFAKYVWDFVGGKPIVNQWKTFAEIPAKTPQSDALSKDLKKRGMSFVGSTIIYAFLQAVGMVDDHLYPHHLKSWFWATRKLSKFADRKRPNINNIRSFAIDELRCFGAAENPTFEVVWV